MFDFLRNASKSWSPVDVGVRVAEVKGKDVVTEGVEEKGT